ncbi:MAG: copper chaperone PCu(A)C [Candidatus Leucobacter sulfamidivorax]|nr:copper chaperone PCu(A)C [Candidatus Leucobacter sulfamidivorax]
MRRTALAALAALAVAAPLLTGCTAAEGGSPATGGSSGESQEHAHSQVTIADGWAKAAETGGMTGLFGTLENHGDHDLVITGVESDAAEMIELHEVTADGVMREIEGPTSIPAGGALELAPGANHIMLMGLTRELLAGDEVEVTVRFDDGTSVHLAVLVKDYSGANEEYDDGSAHADHDERAEH